MRLEFCQNIFESIQISHFMKRGTAVAQWLRCCATNWKVAGSIPAGVIKPFRSHYGPGVDSACNRNEYQEHFLGGKGGRCVRLTTYHYPVPLSRNLGNLTSWNPLGLSRPVMGLLLHFMKIRPVGAELFYAEGRTDQQIGQTERSQ